MKDESKQSNYLIQYALKSSLQKLYRDFEQFQDLPSEFKKNFYKETKMVVDIDNRLRFLPYISILGEKINNIIFYPQMEKLHVITSFYTFLSLYGGKKLLNNIEYSLRRNKGTYLNHKFNKEDNFIVSYDFPKKVSRRINMIKKIENRYNSSLKETIKLYAKFYYYKDKILRLFNYIYNLYDEDGLRWHSRNFIDNYINKNNVGNGRIYLTKYISFFRDDSGRIFIKVQFLFFRKVYIKRDPNDITFKYGILAKIRKIKEKNIQFKNIQIDKEEILYKSSINIPLSDKELDISLIKVKKLFDDSFKKISSFNLMLYNDKDFQNVLY